jgi:hypothetical protein
MQISSERTSLVLAVSTKFVTPKRRYSWLRIHASLESPGASCRFPANAPHSFSSGPQSFLKSWSLTNDATHGCVSSRLPRIACYISRSPENAPHSFLLGPQSSDYKLVTPKRRYSWLRIHASLESLGTLADLQRTHLTRSCWVHKRPL